MTKRLQILFDEEKYRKVQEGARDQKVTVAEWVRQALRQARDGNPGSTDAKLLAIADASRHEFPTADIEVMLQEIESGPHIGCPFP